MTRPHSAPQPQESSAGATRRAYVAIGANLGDARAAVEQAMQRLDALPSTRVTARSALYRSAPHEASGPDFVNAVVAVDTALGAVALLDALQALELDFGRERPYRNAPRTLDLDLLMHEKHVTLVTTRLVLPHPRMTERAFVLLPLADVAPDLVSDAQLHAVAHQPIERLVD